MQASYHGHTEIVRRLLDAGADFNIQNKAGGMTALICASYTGNIEIVKLLLEAGVDHNLQTMSELTALMIASKKGHRDICDLLKKYDISTTKCILYRSAEEPYDMTVRKLMTSITMNVWV